MSSLIPEQELPVELSPFAAVEAAYPAELGRVCEALQRGLPVMVEADKELTPFFYKCLRDRLKREGKQFLYLDGRAAQEPPPGMPAPSLMSTLIAQLRDAVRGAVRERIVVLPHLDLLTTSSGGLTSV